MSEHRPGSARLSCRLLPLSALLPLLLLLLAAVSASANDEPRLGGPSLSPPAPHFLLPHVDNTLYVADDPARLPPAPGSTVLVLGSGGLVGRAVVKWLKDNHYKVAEVKSRSHIDLRQAGSLDSFVNVSFVMFLACEVGGSKFMLDQAGSTQLDIIQHNVQIYQVVFEYLSRNRIPFLFSSTSLVAEPDAYGSIKRLGEAWVKALRLGKIARLWNIYGPEPMAPHRRSHVLADWAAACVRQGGIDSLTDGAELRQFVHSADCAAGLGAAMRHYDQLELVTDVTAPVWRSMRQVAAAFQPYCPVRFAATQAAPRSMLQPRTECDFHRLWWKPNISMEEGVAGLIQYYRDMQRDQQRQQEQEQSQSQSQQSQSDESRLPVPSSSQPPLPDLALSAPLKEDL